MKYRYITVIFALAINFHSGSTGNTQSGYCEDCYYDDYYGRPPNRPYFDLTRMGILKVVIEALLRMSGVGSIQDLLGMVLQRVTAALQGGGGFGDEFGGLGGGGLGGGGGGLGGGGGSLLEALGIEQLGGEFPPGRPRPIGGGRPIGGRPIGGIGGIGLPIGGGSGGGVQRPAVGVGGVPPGEGIIEQGGFHGNIINDDEDPGFSIYSMDYRRDIQWDVTQRIAAECTQKMPKISGKTEFLDYLDRHVKEAIAEHPPPKKTDNLQSQGVHRPRPTIKIPEPLFLGDPSGLEKYVKDNINNVGWRYDEKNSQETCEGNYKLRLGQDTNVVSDIQSGKISVDIRTQCIVDEIAGDICFHFVQKPSSTSVGIVKCECTATTPRGSEIKNETFYFTEIETKKTDPFKYIHLDTDSSSPDSYTITGGWSLHEY